MIDSVLSYHMDGFRCGVARFNHELARRLNVPCQSLAQAPRPKYPLISVKASELEGQRVAWPDVFDLFVHGYSVRLRPSALAARHVYAANPAIADQMRPFRRDVIAAWCPSTIQGTTERAGIRILTFGMAGKLQSPLYEQLRDVLEASHSDYSVNLSCAVHEGASWEQTIGEAACRLQPIFGDHFRLLGFLADAALVAELKRSTGVALFFDPAVRANNTTLWAALEQGCCVVTNLDADSPPELQHDVNVWDIDQLTEWPTADRARAIRGGGRAVVQQYSWERLLEVLK